MLCFQAEMELMERQELGMSVTKQTLPEEFYMQTQADGPRGVYPLYLGERAEKPAVPGLEALRDYGLRLAGTAEKVRGFLGLQ
jgi:hypothetical protein